ncbi:hypothetical protein NHX12_013612, partial [Muraenolepis orangiensis]
MESSALKSELIRDPDLLSDVSEMKQDLIKMTAILIADPTEKSPSLGGSVSENGAEELSGEPLEIMEKDLEKVKEDLEKVSEILRSGTYEGGLAEEAAKASRMAEEWILLSDSEVEEARKMAALRLKEPVLRETRANKGAPRPKAIKDSGDLKEYLLDAPVASKTKAPKEVQEKFTDVVLRKSAKPTAPKISQDLSSVSDVRKPVRKKGKDQVLAEPTETTGHLGVPEAPGPRSPVSPVIEETPIGSIKDKVKALQQKVEAEQNTKKVTENKPSQLPLMSKTSPKTKESPNSKQGPLKSPKAELEKHEETMSVKELMQAFQTGQDPSKRKSGLFEIKTSSNATSENTTKQQTIYSKRTTTAITTNVSPEQELSLDSVSIAVPHSELSDTVDFGHGDLDDSPDSSNHEGVTDSPSASPGETTPHLSSEDSYKHEGLATLDTSPESRSLSPKNGECSTNISASATVKGERQENDISAESGMGTIDEKKSTVFTIPVSTNEAAEDHSTSESTYIRAESKQAKAQKLTKTISETLETFLSDGPDIQLVLPLVGSPASRSSFLNQGSLDLPLRRQDSDALSPLGDDSLTISHRDSLDSSPVMEDSSSQKSPDSIEPSPTRESPCRDSLENSPTEQKSHLPFPPTIDLISIPSSQSCKAPEFPSDALRTRLRDCEASVEDDSCEQTSQMTSSGKSPLSPDTPSSQEVSYEVNPKSPDPMFLSVQSVPTVIPEDPEDVSDSYEALRKFTPEEEMFKMAAKIKTFDEMEQDARSKQNSRKDTNISADIETGDDSSMTVDSTSEYPLQSESGLAMPREDSGLAVCIDSHIKIQPPSPFPAGEHEEINKTSTTTTGDTSKGPHSVSDTNDAQSKLKREHAEKAIASAMIDDTIDTKAAVAEHKEQDSLRELSKDKNDVEVEGHVKSGDTNLQSATEKTEINITHKVKDQMPQKVAESGTGVSAVAGEAKEKSSPETCAHDTREEGTGPPKTESKGVTARAQGDPWNAMREDDAAFAARVKEEEQKILSLMVERPSQQATPDTTPGRTPTEESSPASEPNPFLFQEGKLFEMTRSGAIDMTKRSYEEEGDGFAFFQIGDQPLEEALAEGGGKDSRRASVETEVGLNLTIEVRTKKEEELKDATDIQLPATAECNQVISNDDGSKSKIPKMGVSASSKSTKKDQTPPEAVKADADKLLGEGPVDENTSSSDPMITDVQTAESTVTRSVYSEQSQESSDSSPEEPQSVVESPKAEVKAKQATAANVKKAQVKTQAKSVFQGHGKPTTPTHSQTTLKKEPSFTSESKSRIPIKASITKSDSTVKHTDSTHEKNLKAPVKKDSRRKSETDAGPSMETKSKKTSKAKSFCEGESTRPKPKKDQGCPLSVESAKSKGFQSRLPVRGKAGQVTPTPMPTKEQQQPQKQSLEFFPEISDEAAKLVEKLVQAEKDKERVAADNISDDESSLVDPAVVEQETFPDVQFPPLGDMYPIRPRWDHPIETQMQRIPEHNVPSQVDPQDEAERKEQRLAIIADHLGFSWTGFAALHEDIDSPRTCRRTEAPSRHPVSGRKGPVVSAEELSSSLSSL